MKKLIVFIGLVFLLAACNSQTSETSNEANEVNDADLDQEVVQDEQAPDEEVETKEIESEEPETEESTTRVDKPAKTSQTQQSKEQEKATNNGEEENEHQHLIDLAYQIFDAQREQNYTFLESIISKGTKLDKENNMFYFENVTYPHEQPFLTKEDQGKIEFRYTHENNKDSVIVGFGLINYEAELSYVVDFEFVNENGTWKMNDMDMNK